MAGRIVSRLEAGLIARKGEAAPAQSRPDPSPNAEALAQLGEEDSPDTGKASPSPRGIQGTIAVTVRLDPDRYERLKVHGARRRRTNQDILVEALDRYLSALKE